MALAGGPRRDRLVLTDDERQALQQYLDHLNHMSEILSRSGLLSPSANARGAPAEPTTSVRLRVSP